MAITFLQISDLGPSTTLLTSTNKLLFFPLLSTLILRTCRGIDILPFLDNFTPPSLTSLSLDFGCLSGLNYQAIENLALRSSCSLTSLTLRGMAKQDAVKCFELPCLRSIERLNLNMVHVNNGLVALLVYPDASSTLHDRRGIFPWHKKLSLEWCMAEDGATSRVVASRWRDKSAPSDKSGSVPASLEELEVVFRQDPCTGATCHDVDMAALTSFAKRGLALTYQLASSTPRYQQHPADFCRNCCYHSRYPDLGPCYHPRLPYLDF
ncbi:hypothetical protein Hypma_010922 [Hypsizygus marmoreus]|uniref:F-box domain-containing protein n=1 Tax=Hypsizygus marmoreus TaxID=39966 RepID=A0A369JHU1_HYPMA|nr:hypothetical protein Hypma_010922 [Hypsizygus marmoreus]